MRLSKPVDLETISQALAKGACPICAFLKNEQAALLRGKMQSDEITELCNFHAWALAAAVEVESAAKIFLNVLRHRKDEPTRTHRCSFCVRLLEQEVVELKDLIQQMNSGLVMDWMKQQGTLCLAHGNHIRRLAPLKLQTIIDCIIVRNSTDIEVELDNLLRRTAVGKGTGGGALGRAAEYLVSQRGVPAVTPEEEPC